AGLVNLPKGVKIGWIELPYVKWHGAILAGLGAGRLPWAENPFKNGSKTRVDFHNLGFKLGGLRPA
ncbi:MAG: hypothetical protein WAK29_08655, partial [Terriglobales bacterium]